jgi:hypothetical protein
MMQHLKMGLMDAYLVTRARRLNVLIQPNLRFFHELFGWEVELAREEERIIEQRRKEAREAGVLDPEALALAGLEEGRRRIYYAWPSFCRDLVSAERGGGGCCGLCGSTFSIGASCAIERGHVRKARKVGRGIGSAGSTSLGCWLLRRSLWGAAIRTARAARHGWRNGGREWERTAHFVRVLYARLLQMSRCLDC